ncbi:MAG: peptidase U32 family protein [Bacteroidales bacterium]
MNRQDVEIMAPAGSFESLRAAIQGGADSVYFGAEKLNMRAKSTFNFAMSDLAQITSICREDGVRTYLTINVIIYDEELALMRRVVDKAKEAGIDAIIASDMSVIAYANSVGMEVHISTQLNISNIASLRFYSRFADVVVLARELSLEQIANIAKRVEAEQIKGPSGNIVRLELFVHGALCMAISGKCYLSLHEKNYSANRGECLQTCRKAYEVTEKESGYKLEIDNEYIMSPKDLLTIDFLNKILDSGIKVLKIEGRARSPEYVKTVTECYREAVESYFDGTYTEGKIENWKNRLSEVFNRGFWGGYYLGKKLGEWSQKYGSQAKKRKMYVGKITNYFTNIKVAELLPEANEIASGDEVYIIGPTTGVIKTYLPEIRVEYQPVRVAKKGTLCSFQIDEKLRRSDKIYKIITKE